MGNRHSKRMAVGWTSLVATGVSLGALMSAAPLHAASPIEPAKTSHSTGHVVGQPHSVSLGSGNVASTCSLVANEAGVSASTSDLDNRFLMSVTNISPKTEFNHAGTMKFDTSRTSQIFAPGRGSQIEVEQLDKDTARSYGYCQASMVKLYIMTDPTEGPQDPENYGYFADLVVGTDTGGGVSLLVKAYEQEARLAVGGAHTYTLKMPQERGWPNPDFPLTIKFTGTKDLAKGKTLAMLSVNADWRTAAQD